VKEAAKRALAAAALRLPRGARRAIYESLAKDAWAEKEITRFAKSIGITGFIAGGESGLVQGDSRDLFILPSYARHGRYAAGTNNLFIELFKDGGGDYLDIGANIGLTTIPIARNPAVRCHSFEPDPVIFAHLLENIRRNCPHLNVETHHTAIGAENGTVPFAINPVGNRGDNRVVPTGDGDPGWQVINVPVHRLDDMVSTRVGLPLGVKIDTQGYEPFVLEGGANTFARATLIVLEFAPFLMSKNGAVPSRIIDFLSNFDQAAIKDADSDDDPHFESTISVCKKLLNFVTIAQEGEYVDVVAKR